MNSRNEQKIPEEVQNLLCLNQETLIKHLVHQCNFSYPTKVLETTKERIHEVIFEAIIDGAQYYLVRCQPQPSQIVHLSPRELSIAHLIAQGLPNKCISEQLKISCWTVNTHLRRIFIKLGVTSRAAMVARLMDAHLLGNTYPRGN